MIDLDEIRRRITNTPLCGDCRINLEHALTAASGSTHRAQAPEPERVAAMFHHTYEQLAPQYGYETREASRKPWSEVPEQNRALMVAVCAKLLHWLGRGAPGGRPSPRAFIGEPVCGKPDCPCHSPTAGQPERRDTVRLADLDLQQDGQA